MQISAEFNHTGLIGAAVGGLLFGWMLRGQI